MSMNILAHRINMDSSWNEFDVFDHDYPIIDYPDLDYPNLDYPDFFPDPNFAMNIYWSWTRSVAIFFNTIALKSEVKVC